MSGAPARDVLAADLRQLSGIPGTRDAARACASGAALRIATCGLAAATLVAAGAFTATGCATSRVGIGGDAAGSADAGAIDSRVATPDAHAADAPLTADATPADASSAADANDPGCAISQSATTSPALDGNGDLAKYPATNVTAPGAPLAGTDEVALTWDRTNLYVTVTSDAFLDQYQPLHVYVQTGAAPLAAAVPSTGKEYGGLTPQLPFTATHVIAIRRTSDSGTGPYDGVYTPGSSWDTRATPLTAGTDVFASSDNRTLSARVPWTALGGCPTAMRLTTHVVHGVAANEWKDLLPVTTTPWVAPGGGYFEIDLTQPPPMSGWAVH
jgi:hypothetical protein